MTATPDEPKQADEAEDPRDSRDDDAMRALLKRSLDVQLREAPPRGEVLRGVQKRIRTRSRGRFFANGWSTGNSRVNQGLVALVMLVIVGVAYVALGPMGISK